MIYLWRAFRRAAGEQSVAAGVLDSGMARTADRQIFNDDPDFNPLRGREGFKAVLMQIRNSAGSDPGTKRDGPDRNP